MSEVLSPLWSVWLFTTTRPISLGTWGPREKKGQQKDTGLQSGARVSRSDKTFLGFASLWRLPFILEDASRPLYYLNEVDAVLQVCPGYSTQERLRACDPQALCQDPGRLQKWTYGVNEASLLRKPSAYVFASSSQITCSLMTDW